MSPELEKRVQGAGNTNCAALSYAGTFQAELRYDPLGRLYYIRDYVGGNGFTRFLYDGNAVIAEYNGSGIMLRRYVHGTNAEADDPLVQFTGPAIDCPGTRFLQTDPRGSVVALADCWGNHLVTNTYDAYGIPDSATGNDIATKGRFRYTGQMWIPELGMYYYKARVYSPTLGRFLQTDPIGYEDQFNLYAYVGNDPVNAIDPRGTDTFYVSRAAGGTAGLFDHGFVVVADKAGGEIKAIFSYTDIDGNLKPSSFDSSPDSTLNVDRAAWNSIATGDADADGVTFNRVDVSDDATIKAGNAVNNVLTENDVDYDALPHRDNDGCNSNCGAAAVANTARRIDGKGGTHPAPSGARPAPGRGSSDKIESGIVLRRKERE